MKTILLLTEQYDPTADNLMLVLAARGQTVFRWNLDRYPVGSTLSLVAGENGHDGTIAIDGRRIGLGEIKSAWYRALRARGFPKALKGDNRIFATREVEAVVNALPQMTDWRWMNDPRAHREAVWKPAQLALARQIGFAVPRSLITNDAEAVRRFWQDCDRRIIYKVLSQSLNLEPGKAAFTRMLGEADIKSLALIEHTPGIFQAYVEKAYELRITVVAGQIFSARIDSQRQEKTRTDWRTAPYDLQYAQAEIPEPLAERIRTFMARSGLAYSCLDFIVTPEGEYVFLESNPRGQYLWIEHYTGLPITEAVADYLAA